MMITVLVYFDLFEVLSFWCNINWKKDGFDNVVLMTKPFSEHKKDLVSHKHVSLVAYTAVFCPSIF